MKYSGERLALYAKAAKDRGLFFDGNKLPYLPALTPYARTLRRSMTRCEKRVWGFLKKLNTRVRAQHPIDKYIVDFYLPEFDVVIEIDGEQHHSTEGKEYDEYRREILSGYLLSILRITNNDVRNNFSGVCFTIREHLKHNQKLDGQRFNYK